MTETNVEFFRIPDPEDQEYWERIIATGLHQPAPEPSGNGTNTYAWIDLTNPEYATPPDPPAIEGILYAGRRHVISGPPESTKTLIAYMLLLQALRAGEGVAILDFEMGPHAAATLLRELGATHDEIARIQYTEPNGPPADHDIDQITGLGCGYVLIDAAAGAYDTTGLDDNSRKDAEHFATKWIRPLWQAGTATIVIDHVTKNAETRGKFAIGSERKAGQADVHLGLEAIKTLTRGGTGLIKVTVHKDRPGFLDRPTACYYELQSDPDTHRINWHVRPHDEPDETGDIRPTVLMERVSQYLERQHEPVSRNNIESEVKGKSAEYKRKAIDHLIREGYATEEIGSRNARMVTAKRPYRIATDPLNTTSSDLVSTSSRRSDLTSSDDVPPHGGVDEVTAPDEHHLVQTNSLDVHDPAVQALLDEDIPW